MFTKTPKSQNPAPDTAHREGDLYKVVTTYGKTFELRYGYYEEKDRLNPLCKPAIIYPDFLKNPLFTDDGKPFVTVMQDACVHYKGNAKRTSDTNCADCCFFRQGEEWFGVCSCANNRKL